ncbi:MAG: endonuclease Q family protein [Methanomicrobiales archaeon]|nr:endonuclease Q family protein [Methanomicrobiales archaeon]
MLVNADLHIHSPFAMGTSRFMDLPRLGLACARKGLQVLGSGDALHPEWRARCRREGESIEGVLIVPTTEVEDTHRIHHLILLEDFCAAETLADAFRPWSDNILHAGRPRLSLTGEDIAREVHAQGGLIGPAHAFTPWTSLYARFDRLRECYGEQKIDFLELGLSADSSYAAGIPDLKGVPFLSNSDAHSADPVKVGREWNSLQVTRLTIRAVLESITRNDVIFNAGFFPEAGKYNRTACSRCYRQYSLDGARSLSWRCPHDRGRIKKGVCDRARELSTAPPSPRPPYYHRIPLGEIVQDVLGSSSPHTKKCQALYESLVTGLGDEIGILMNAPLSEIGAINEEVAYSIHALREGEVTIFPGGGGRYGTFSLKSKHYGMSSTTDHNA